MSRDSGNMSRDSGNMSRNSGNMNRDLGNMSPNSGNIRRDSGNMSRDCKTDCKTIHPALMEAAAKHPDVIWLRAMADSNRELCKRQNVGTFPHIYLYRNHNLLANFNLDISNPEKLDTSVQTVKTTPTGTFKVRRQFRLPCFYLIGGLFPT